MAVVVLACLLLLLLLLRWFKNIVPKCVALALGEEDHHHGGDNVNICAQSCFTVFLCVCVCVSAACGDCALVLFVCQSVCFVGRV